MNECRSTRSLECRHFSDELNSCSGVTVICSEDGQARTQRLTISEHKQAEARLSDLGVPLPSRVLPQATAPPQLSLCSFDHEN